MDIMLDLEQALNENPKGYSVKDDRIIVPNSLDITPEHDVKYISNIDSDYFFIESNKLKQISNSSCRVNMIINSPEIFRINDTTSHFISIKENGKLAELKNIKANSIFIERQNQWESGKKKIINVDNVSTDFYFYLKDNNPDKTQYLITNSNINRLYVSNPNDIILTDTAKIDHIMYQDRELLPYQEFVDRFNITVYNSDEVYDHNLRRYVFKDPTKPKHRFSFETGEKPRDKNGSILRYALNRRFR